MLMEFLKKSSANLNGKIKYQRICKSENCEKYLYISIKKFLNKNWDEQKHTFDHVLDKNKCISNQGEDVIEKTISIFRYVYWRVLNSTSYKYGVFWFYFFLLFINSTHDNPVTKNTSLFVQVLRFGQAQPLCTLVRMGLFWGHVVLQSVKVLFYWSRTITFIYLTRIQLLDI